MTSEKTKFINNGSYIDFMHYENEEELKQTSQTSPVQYDGKKVEPEISLLFATLCTICEEKNLVIILPVKAIAVTTVTTIAGMLMRGLTGMAVGCIAGAVISYRSLRRPNKKLKWLKNLKKKITLPEIFVEMTIDEKTDLFNEFLRCFIQIVKLSFDKQLNVKQLVFEICKSEKFKSIAIMILSKILFKKFRINLEPAK